MGTRGKEGKGGGESGLLVIYLFLNPTRVNRGRANVQSFFLPSTPSLRALKGLALFCMRRLTSILRPLVPNMTSSSAAVPTATSLIREFTSSQ